MNIRTSQTRALGTAAVGAILLLASCGSEAESAVEAEIESTTTTEAASAPSTEPVAVVDEIPEDTINVETKVIPQGGSFGGTFVVDQGAHVLGCDSGSVAESGSPQGITNTFTCEDGDREGSFTFRWTIVEGSDGPGDANGPWTVVGTTGDFAGLAGEGLWSGTGEGETGFGSFPGVIEFGPVEGPAEADPAIVADLSAFIVAFYTGDGDTAWNAVSQRCQEVVDRDFHRDAVTDLTLSAPRSTVADISTVVEGDRAAVTYYVFDEAGVLFAPYFAQPWSFADGTWFWDAC